MHDGGGRDYARECANSRVMISTHLASLRDRPPAGPAEGVTIDHINGGIQVTAEGEDGSSTHYNFREPEGALHVTARDAAGAVLRAYEASDDAEGHAALSALEMALLGLTEAAYRERKPHYPTDEG